MPSPATLCWTLLLVAACAGDSGLSRERPAPGIAPAGKSLAVFSADDVIQDQWRHVNLKGPTEYRLAFVDEQLAIRAVGRNSASLLIRWVEIEHERCPNLEWQWRVDRLQADADLRLKAREDVAASLFLLFGDPGFLSDPNPVPTLRYVWTNDREPIETVIINPYLPKSVRSVVVESGEDRLGEWVHERRNVAQDFARAFGHPPQDPISAIALFTDNDQTEQPVEAYYSWARAICAP